jgi:ribosomal protein S18 acetylase RimI-like enzyme
VNDPRIAPVEDNLLSFYSDALTSPILNVADLDGARGYYTDIAFPLCNVVFDARFEPGRAAEQTRAVLTEYTDRGLPFLWWATPSTTSPELELACAEVGMIRTDVPGMHRPLAAPVEVRTPEGVELELATAEDLGTLIDVMLAGFGMPEWLKDPLTSLFDGFTEDRLVNVLARVDGEPVASGSAYLKDGTAGIYNIATLEGSRGRGIGYAVTAWLMNAGRERGCTETILHASSDGYPVYERLGFETVCTLPQMVWVPSD